VSQQLVCFLFILLPCATAGNVLGDVWETMVTVRSVFYQTTSMH
jgi:hypothetical protein